MAKYCSSCGKEIAEGIKFCPSCGKAAVSEASSPVQIQTVQTQIQIKNPGIAALLSFFISGAGQIYNGQLGNGIGVLLLVLALYFIGISTIDIGIGFLLLLIATILWIWAIYDAYTTAQKINRGEIKV
ncbi:MAG: zinc-ribbon domain-containing protein [Euryarchaeota archaeon]|nr:zinc-ribbon domain-containing protein [Euryarchaeota archaeon]MCG2738288.1 zinc-ribbon domain-containing protein [Candidatus Methanoperedenaceae archaeon]